jgi:hypothetical protein
LEIKDNDLAYMESKCAEYADRITYLRYVISEHMANCNDSDCLVMIEGDEYISDVYYKVQMFNDEINEFESLICELENAGEIDPQEIDEIQELTGVLKDFCHAVDAEIVTVKIRIEYLIDSHATV